ncbi:putative tetratricopeptide-like helical domain superfamily [Helianthus annuus]|uniref:Putative tetratricopeptide repeat (TPR)-like superfamily protein n=1 Tax=Helianthus annuus TaxID=4232 RepID=A0A251TFG9_HELAN|nr:pentatricopeptide repeat-containing protein At2g36980, mitochondrial [Helianthus annuus]XP_021987348.1 pentatricopeptide repeat-containing protein At2g36980, mitochondrial [Helianthus annuus]KAF5784914.1 putative tetratricopeptide-like helical domain superfamily [Helianthus annuus]KAJ0512543.1 putative tetratricopeptide-like helical domain superfamily [Helianthus annuus]KAJ0520099.1 putative tetratricopeptide-like helical domain superfamily [Helianthus annuus]KAJ0528669.1 putative tetratric
MGSYLVHTTSKIAALAKSGRVTHARKLFDEMPHRDTVVWNTMLTCYTHLDLYQDALLLFHEMTGVSNTKPDHYSFTATLSACAGSCKLRYGQSIHALVVSAGYCSSVPVNNALIDMYAKCFSPCSAHKVFEEIEFRNHVSWCSLLFAYVHTNEFQVAQTVFDSMPNKVNIAWNTMIAGHARHGNVDTCVDLFKKMMAESCDQDQWTYSALMNASAESQQYCVGCMVHACIVKNGWSSAVEASNSILSFYAQIGSPADAVKMFESMKTLTQVSWNAIIDAQMKIGDTHKAVIAFQQAPEKNVVSWTSMMTGYVRNGNAEEAVGYFVNMSKSSLRPDDFSLGTVLHACSVMATLGHGKMIHSLAIVHGFHGYAYVGNGLVNMYAKCGDVRGSKQAFDDISEKDLVSWNTMLIAYGLHGWGEKALKIYEEMLASGLKADKVTFISLLMTCSHLGLIDKGWTLFKSMSRVHGIVPETDHVACVVDMLARGGYLEEAREMANRYRTHGMIGRSSEAVFGACYAHGDVLMGTELVGELSMLEPECEMSYVVLSNLYCASEKWKEAELVRKQMADYGVKKTPGCSWIEVKNKVSAFVAGSSLCEYKEEISSIIYLLEYQLKNP